MSLVGGMSSDSDDLGGLLSGYYCPLPRNFDELMDHGDAVLLALGGLKNASYRHAQAPEQPEGQKNPCGYGPKNREETDDHHGQGEHTFGKGQNHALARVP